MAPSRLDTPRALEILESGDVRVLGVLPYASNYTFLAEVNSRDGGVLAVYKPRKGERPLWDFPRGTLANREVAAFLVSEAAGWNIVPPTVLRDGGELGEGSLQLFIDHDPDRHYFAMEEERADDLLPFAAFDVVVNNADRKAGHVLEGRDGRLWAVDHGVTFHSHPKLRTVIWRFAGEPVDDATRARLERLREALGGDGALLESLARLLTPQEAEATLVRAERLLAAGRLPQPGPHHPLPWPLV